VTLFRNGKDLNHWYVRVSEKRWMSFPARINGWAARQELRRVEEGDLHQLPLWLAFNTGIPPSHRARLPRSRSASNANSAGRADCRNVNLI